MLGIASLPPATGKSVAAPRKRPNFLIIVTDDQRADALNKMSATKRLMGGEGTRFTKAYVTTPLCCPSRASILTGQYVHNHGVLTAGKEDRDASEAAENAMIQKRLHQAGYRTALYGKYLNNWSLHRSPKNLDDWAIFANSNPDGYRSGIWNVNGTMERIERYSTSYIRERAIDFISDQESNDAQPWFLYLSPAAPHAPFLAEPRYRDEQIDPWRGNPAAPEGDRSDKPPWVQESTTGQHHAAITRAKQLRTLMSVDDLVGGVIGSLKRLDEDRDTFVVYTSDNGYMWGEHGLDAKRWPYLQAIHVPLFVRQPGVISQGHTDYRLVANIDIAPTIAELARVSLPNSDGTSLLEGRHRPRLLLEYFSPSKIPAPPTWAATITKEYEYIEYYDSQGELQTREYYDLDSDPWQLLNLLGDDDVTNDPLPVGTSQYSLQLEEDRSCKGNNCP